MRNRTFKIAEFLHLALKRLWPLSALQIYLIFKLN